MGASPMLYRGRMPVFYYLSEQEAADVYLYLTRYPPADSVSVSDASALVQTASPGGGTKPGQAIARASSLTANRAPEIKPPSEATARQTVILLTSIASFVALLLAGGLGFTIHEFKRLSAARRLGSLAVSTKLPRRNEDATASLQRIS